MAQERINEALSHLRDDWPIAGPPFDARGKGSRACRPLGRAEAQKLPPEFLTRIRAIEEEMHELSRLCQNPPLPPRHARRRNIDDLPLF
jgi:hypothetical protein